MQARAFRLREALAPLIRIVALWRRQRPTLIAGILISLATLAAGIALMAVSVIMQLVILALSRLREHYADAHGAEVTSPDAMISALQGLDDFYSRHRVARARVDSSKMKMLFIYALADPFVSLEELFATHPPIPKRIQFLRSLKMSKN